MTYGYNKKFSGLNMIAIVYQISQNILGLSFKSYDFLCIVETIDLRYLNKIQVLTTFIMIL